MSKVQASTQKELAIEMSKVQASQSSDALATVATTMARMQSLPCLTDPSTDDMLPIYVPTFSEEGSTVHDM